MSEYLRSFFGILLIPCLIIGILMILMNTIRFFLCPPSLQGFFENTFPTIEAWSMIFCLGVLSFWILAMMNDVFKKEEVISDE